MRRKLLEISTAFLLSLLLHMPVQAQTFTQEPFPGKGSEQSWKQACEICNQGMQLFQMQRFAEASQMFEKAMEIYSFDSLFSYGAGLAHQSNAYLLSTPADKKAELESAVKFFDLSTKLKSDRFDCWIHMANVQSELQEYDKSLKNLQTALAIPGISHSGKAQTQSAMEFVKSKLASPTAQNVQAGPSAEKSNSTASSAMLSYSNPSSGITMQYPDGWRVTSDPKNGKIDVVHNDGTRLTVLPFATTDSFTKDNASTFLKALLKSFAPE
ncbi:MAG: tetratricopeptide repeat protein, partial [Cyanobacteria bacterium]|nr:tetratricopeptide repeat protein [Cyanobacteriota bacterium]